MKRNNKKKGLDLEKLTRSHKKVVLGFQCNPLIKFILVKQAEKRGLNLSQYVTELLLKSIIVDDDVILNENIEILNFSTRTYNCLVSANIETIKDLINHKNNLLNIRNFGNKCMQEIEDCLDEIHLLLDMNKYPTTKKPLDLGINTSTTSAINNIKPSNTSIYIDFDKQTFEENNIPKKSVLSKIFNIFRKK
jgi:hypothetical protein